MEGKGAYESPVFKEQKAKEELSDICMEILRDARNELYLSMRFLDVALSSLYFVPDFAVCGLGTDGNGLFFHPSGLASMYRKNRICVNRAYLHSVFHCLKICNVCVC